MPQELNGKPQVAHNLYNCGQDRDRKKSAGVGVVWILGIGTVNANMNQEGNPC